MLRFVIREVPAGLKAKRDEARGKSGEMVRYDVTNLGRHIEEDRLLSPGLLYRGDGIPVEPSRVQRAFPNLRAERSGLTRGCRPCQRGSLPR